MPQYLVSRSYEPKLEGVDRVVPWLFKSTDYPPSACLTFNNAEVNCPFIQQTELEITVCPCSLGREYDTWKRKTKKKKSLANSQRPEVQYTSVDHGIPYLLHNATGSSAQPRSQIWDIGRN